MAIVIKSKNVGTLGRRWIAECDVCVVKLPGHHVERSLAETVGTIHENERHLSRVSARLREATS